MMKVVCSLSIFVLALLQVSAQNNFMTRYKYADSVFSAGAYDTALQLFDALLVFPGTDSLSAEIRHRKGIIFLIKGVEDSAFYYEQQALDVFTEQMNFAKMSRVQGNISQLYASKGIYDKALQYNLSALGAARMPDDSLREYFNLCNLYQAQKKFHEMYEVLEHHIRFFADGLLYKQAFLTASNFAIYFGSEKKRDSALYYCKLALANAITAGDSSAAYNNIADEYRLAYKYPLALAYLDSALLISREAADIYSQLISCKTYVEVAGEMKDYQTALRYSELSRELSDSIFENGKANALLAAGVKYEAAKKEAANQLLAKDNTLKQRNLIYSLAGFALLFLVAVLIFRSNRQKQKANRILTRQKIELEELAARLEQANQTKLLLLSTIGHDLRSPLSSLYALLKMQEIKRDQGIVAVKESTTVSSSQVTGLLTILENLLAWSKLKMFDTDLRPLLQKVFIQELYAEQVSFFAPLSASKKVLVVNNAPDHLQLTCDDYILGTIIRNAVSNAISNTTPGEAVFLEAESNDDGSGCCTIKNKCSAAAFDNFNEAYNTAAVQSGSHGLGLVLMKAFAHTIGAVVQLSYSGGFAVISILVKAVR